jgi:FtsH-binding integral membrane protein
MAQTSAGQPPQTAPYPGVSPAPSKALSGDQTRAVFGQVMGLVALTLGSLALGAYIGRDMSGGLGILFFVAGCGCIVGLSVASARGHEQLAIFGGWTILDFNRLRRAGAEDAVSIAASIFLDVLNVFLFFLELFGGGRD